MDMATMVTATLIVLSIRCLPAQTALATCSSPAPLASSTMRSLLPPSSPSPRSSQKHPENPTPGGTLEPASLNIKSVSLTHRPSSRLSYPEEHPHDQPYNSHHPSEPEEVESFVSLSQVAVNEMGNKNLIFLFVFNVIVK